MPIRHPDSDRDVPCQRGIQDWLNDGIPYGEDAAPALDAPPAAPDTQGRKEPHP
jgi:hypothetical protein